MVEKVESIDEIVRAAKLRTLHKDVFRIYFESKQIVDLLYRGLPRVVIRFLAAKAMIAFPGGLYGFLAFFAFLMLAILKLLTIYHKVLTPIA